MRSIFLISAAVLIAAAVGIRRNQAADFHHHQGGGDHGHGAGRAAASHPGLAENCLAEGRRWAETGTCRGRQGTEGEPGVLHRGPALDVRAHATSSPPWCGRYVSVIRDDGTYEGGAHPNSRIDTILWDRDQKKRISIRPFFRETADNGPTMTAIARLARIAVAAEKLERGAINVDEEKEKLTPERLAELDHADRGRHPAVAAQARAGHACALDAAGQERGSDVSLLAL